MAVLWEHWNARLAGRFAAMAMRAFFTLIDYAAAY